MRFSLFRDWVMPEYQPIEKNEKVAKRAIFDLVTFRSRLTSISADYRSPPKEIGLSPGHK